MAATSWLEDYQRRVREIGDRAERVRGALGQIGATATTGAGAVTVTVGAEGVLRQISFGPRADELTRPALAELVLQATRQACADASRQAGEALDELVGMAGGGEAAASQQTDGSR